MNDYFVEKATYSAADFRRRFRMSRSLFLRIVGAVQQVDAYFVQAPDAAGELGFTVLQKCTFAILQLVYGVSSGALEDSLWMAESTSHEGLHRFAAAALSAFDERYLRHPNEQDVTQLLAENAARGFPKMLDSLDCMHWAWMDYLTAWAGQFTGKAKKPTLIFESAASQNLHIWHAFFDMLERTMASMTSASSTDLHSFRSFATGENQQSTLLSTGESTTWGIILQMRYIRAL